MNLLSLIQARFHDALQQLVPDPQPYLAMIKPAQDAKHGDYQANCAMSLAKSLGKKPRDVAQEIVDRLELGDFLQKPEIAGPGFINVRLQDSWLAERLRGMALDARLGVEPVSPARTIVIDFSSVNVAKPMHVGHLRTTIIGDALARLLRFMGHHVIADNHLGDWGTQFGILLYGFKNLREDAAFKTDPVRELTRLYLAVRNLMQVDEDDDTRHDPIGNACRLETARLHEGDPENVRLWKEFMPWCLEEINQIYRRLDVVFDHTLGESFYQPMLADVVQDLLDKGIAQVSKGAVAIFFGEKEPPALIRKTDCAFTYTTTDLATVKYRVETFKADTALYVVDFRQSLHFKNVFDAARRWGYDKIELTHISFGSVLGKDGRPLKTREGGMVELGALLDEAVSRAEQVYERAIQEALDQGQTPAILSPEEKAEVYQAIGLGAVKYADFCQNRNTDYKFDFDKMLAMNGNTATYMQYAYARNRSIFLKSGEEVGRFRAQPPLPLLESAHERALALQLLRLEENLLVAAAEYQPNVITSYLWDLAKAYSGFFQNCPVLKANTPALRESRLLLCDLTGRVLKQCLELLGIRTVERM